MPSLQRRHILAGGCLLVAAVLLARPAEASDNPVYSPVSPAITYLDDTSADTLYNAMGEPATPVGYGGTGGELYTTKWTNSSNSSSSSTTNSTASVAASSGGLLGLSHTAMSTTASELRGGPDVSV
ncbi:hypothetical protein HK405_014967, partial [Cladochytrium tenue]